MPMPTPISRTKHDRCGRSCRGTWALICSMLPCWRGWVWDERCDTHVVPVVPFCPMLTQGWQLLRVRDVTLSEDLQKARDDLRPALWTTFGPRGMESIASAVRAAKAASPQ